MSNRNDKLRAAVSEILWRDWDPIGMKRSGGPRDEYESYVSGVIRRLEREATESAINRHLARLETESMGLNPCADSARADAVAALLRVWREAGGVGDGSL